MENYNGYTKLYQFIYMKYQLQAAPMCKLHLQILGQYMGKIIVHIDKPIQYFADVVRSVTVTSRIVTCRNLCITLQIKYSPGKMIYCLALRPPMPETHSTSDYSSHLLLPTLPVKSVMSVKQFSLF